MALIAAGQSSTITGTLAGQVVMEGFVHIRLRPLVRRLLTRALAIVPAVITILFFGERATRQPAAPVAGDPLAPALLRRRPAGPDRLRPALDGAVRDQPLEQAAGWLVAAVIAVLNLKLVFDGIVDWLQSAGQWAWLVG